MKQKYPRSEATSERIKGRIRARGLNNVQLSREIDMERPALIRAADGYIPTAVLSWVAMGRSLGLTVEEMVGDAPGSHPGPGRRDI